jgi:carboxypeptidase C (cathepsin A)
VAAEHGQAPPERNPIGASRAADEVKSLPGWEGALPSKHYSGYLDVGLSSAGVKNIHIHYWLSESERSPENDPVVFWMNGGPGGSSLIGGLTENGPFYMDDSSFEDPSYNKTGVPKLKSRPQRWNRLANTVYVETPAMTGFSYCDHDNTTANGDCPWNDETTAEAHYQMTLAFFDAFPSFKNRELYFTGESYAGLCE